MDERAPTLLRFDGIEFDPAELRLLRDGELIELQPKVSRLLEILLARAGQLVPKETLVEELWPESFVNDEALTQLVRKLRKALGDDAHQPRYLQTVTTRGYRFLAPVSEGSGEPPVTPSEAPEAPQGAPVAQRAGVVAVPATTRPVPSWLVEDRARAHLPKPRSRRVVWLAVALVTVAVVVASAWWVMRPRVRPLRAGCCEAQRVTFSGVHKQDLTFSPDGRMLAFAVNDPREGQLDLMLVSAEGGTEVRLTHTATDEYDPQLAPAGDLVLFGRIEAGERLTALVVPPLGGAERVVAIDAAWATFAPSGQAIAFVRRRPDGWRLIVKGLNDESEREVGRSFLAPRSLAYSPDGALLAYTEGRRLLAIDLASGAERQIGEEATEIGSLAWERPTGSLLFDARWVGGSNIWRMGRGGGPAEAVTAGSGQVFHPAVSPDARRVAYVQERLEYVLYDLDALGKARRTLPLDPTLHEVDVDPAGRRIVGRRGELQQGRGRIAAGPLDGGAALHLGGANAGLPVFSPDGRAVAWVEREAGGEGLRVADERGAGVWALPVEKDRELGRPAFAPDGRELAVAVVGADEALVAVPVGGGTTRRLAAGRFASAAWSPDGRTLAAAGVVNGEAGTFVIDAATGTTRRLTPQRSYSAAPVFSRDSRSLFVLVDERSRPRLLHLDLDGRGVGPAVELAIPVEPSFWGVFEIRPLPDGWLAVLERRDSDIWLLQQGSR